MKTVSFLTPLLACAAALPAPEAEPLVARATGALSAWLASGSSVSLQGVLANIGANGAKAQGAAAGVVVASPSKSNPDCMYTTARRGLIIIQCVLSNGH